MGNVLSLERRQSLLTWVQCVGACIIGDDYNAAFTYRENLLPALKAANYYSRVIYMETFSRTLEPGARLDYPIYPDGLLPTVQNMKALNNNGGQQLLQQFLTGLMQNQIFYTHLSKLTCDYATRLTLLRDGLSILFPEEKIAGVMVDLHLSLCTARHTEFIARLQQGCLLTGIRFDTLSGVENELEVTWCKENSGAVMFFGFGGLQIQQINRVLTVLEQAPTQP